MRKGTLMDTHGVRERTLEEVVVSFSDLGQNLRKLLLLLISEMKDRRNVPSVWEN